MSKKDFLGFFVFFSIVLFAGNCFAALGSDFSVPETDDATAVIEDSSGGPDITGSELSFSSGVEAAYTGSDTFYTAGTKNTQAGENTKTYVSTSDESIIYTKNSSESALPTVTSTYDWSDNDWAVLGD
jgi:hypothetical protein